MPEVVVEVLLIQLPVQVVLVAVEMVEETVWQEVMELPTQEEVLAVAVELLK